jgi:hypothetical protein
MRVTVVFLIAAMMAMPAGAHDVDGLRAAVREACRADAETFCRGIQPGGGRIKACLRSNRDRLSQGCRSAIASAIEARAARWRSGAQSPAPTTTP